MGVSEISGHFILPQLQNTKFLADVCVFFTRTIQGTADGASYHEPLFTRVCLNFHHLDIQSRCGGIIWLPSRGSWLLLSFVHAC